MESIAFYRIVGYAICAVAIALFVWMCVEDWRLRRKRRPK